MQRACSPPRASRSASCGWRRSASGRPNPTRLASSSTQVPPAGSASRAFSADPALPTLRADARRSPAGRRSSATDPAGAARSVSTGKGASASSRSTRDGARTAGPRRRRWSSGARRGAESSDSPSRGPSASTRAPSGLAGSVAGAPVPSRRLRGPRERGDRRGASAAPPGRWSRREPSLRARRRDRRTELARARLRCAELERRVPELGERCTAPPRCARRLSTPPASRPRRARSTARCTSRSGSRTRSASGCSTTTPSRSAIPSSTPRRSSPTSTSRTASAFRSTGSARPSCGLRGDGGPARSASPRGVPRAQAAREGAPGRARRPARRRPQGRATPPAALECLGGSRVRRPRLLLYCQHSLGLGHAVRSFALAVGADRALPGRARLRRRAARRAASPTTTSSSSCLPPLRASRNGALVSRGAGERGAMRAGDDASSCSRRSDRSGRGVVVVELFPFGRRRFADELVPLLEEALAAAPRPLVVSSVRDILVGRGPDQQAHDTISCVLANRYLDAVLVHSDPRFARLEESFRPGDPAAGTGPAHGLRRAGGEETERRPANGREARVRRLGRRRARRRAAPARRPRGPAAAPAGAPPRRRRRARSCPRRTGTRFGARRRGCRASSCSASRPTSASGSARPRPR